ncbi:MAG TPA: hypothetical protein VK853_11890 [Ilumatobacteraceae bacterium]|nr:hypothetical protein [Ilumatobacteraceae bacterium]
MTTASAAAVPRFSSAVGGALAGLIGALVSVPIAAAGSAALATVNGGFQFDDRAEGSGDRSAPGTATPSVAPPSSDDDEPEFAHGATTLSDVLHEAAVAGFDGEFEVAGDVGELRCSHCRHVIGAADADRAWSRRLEGASDPDDMLHVSALTCPVCGGRGVFVSQFGAAASAGESAVLEQLRDPGIGR